MNQIEDIQLRIKTLNKEVFSFENLIQASYEHFGVELNLDNNNEKVLKNILNYFKQENSSLNLKKGILLLGPIGTGKTFLFKLIGEILRKRDEYISTNLFTIKDESYPSEWGGGEYYPKEKRYSDLKIIIPRLFKIVTSRELTQEYSISGYSSLKWYGDSYSYEQYCIDDLGLEPVTSKYYGESVSVISEVLLNRYDNFINDNDSKTYATSNLDQNNLKKLYGDRVTSRMKQMFNVLVLKGPDRRI